MMGRTKNTCQAEEDEVIVEILVREHSLLEALLGFSIMHPLTRLQIRAGWHKRFAGGNRQVLPCFALNSSISIFISNSQSGLEGMREVGEDYSEQS